MTALVVANLTPVGSSDTASYAAYGRIAALGGDPYVTTPARLGGAYAHLVSEAWRNTPSVYGPLATWWQGAAAFIGQERPWLTIWALMLANATVFVGTGYLLLRTADDPVRAGLVWSVNPLLIGVLVEGGHLDALRRGPGRLRGSPRPDNRWHHDLIVGGLVGLACGVKISACLFGVGLAWPLLRSGRWRPATRQACAAALTLAALYGAYGARTGAALRGLPTGLRTLLVGGLRPVRHRGPGPWLDRGDRQRAVAGGDARAGVGATPPRRSGRPLRHRPAVRAGLRLGPRGTVVDAVVHGSRLGPDGPAEPGPPDPVPHRGHRRPGPVPTTAAATAGHRRPRRAGRRGVALCT